MTNQAAEAGVAITVADWVEALRAARVLQGTNYLMQDTATGGRAYCCLGIACELSELGTWGRHDAGDRAYAYGVGEWAGGLLRPATPELHSTGTLPAAVRDVLGLRTGLGEFQVTSAWLDALYSAAPDVAAKVAQRLEIEPNLVGAVPTSLAGLNDNGFTFAEIAEVIASNPPGLFWEDADCYLIVGSPETT